jgi:hypothetical protein
MSFQNPFRKRPQQSEILSKKQKTDLEQESREKINDGDALPTPAFALEEGGEALYILEDQIRHFLTRSELFDLRRNLIDIQKFTNENNVEALQSDRIDQSYSKLKMRERVAYLLAAINETLDEGTEQSS